MESFRIEFKTEPTEGTTAEALEAAHALALAHAERTDDLLEETVTGTEPASPNPAGAEAAARTALRTQRGARANYLGLTVGAYVGRTLGACRIKPFANHHDLDGAAFQIRTINGSQTTFTVNVDTEPEKIIVAARKRDKQLQGVSRYLLYGVLREDAFARAKKSGSKGHVRSGHHLVSLTQVQKVELGTIIIPDDLVLADTSEQRLRLLERIAMLEPDLGNPTVQAARTFLTGAVQMDAPNGASNIISELA